MKRRNLPHLEVPGKSYFITWKTRRGEVLTNAERDIVLNCIRHFQNVRYVVSIAVVMPDHVHILFRPIQREPKNYWALEDLLKGMKGVSARRINLGRKQRGAFWQDESYDHVIRNSDDWREKRQYILLNPARNKLVQDPAEYRWLWIAD